MNKWVDECWRLAACLFLAIAAGLLSGHVMLALVLALALYSLWMIYRFYELHTWLEGGAKTEKTPDTVGLASTIVQLVHRERKHRQRQKEKLRGTLQQFNALASQLPDATVVLDDKLQIQWCNTAAATLFGVERKRDSGQRIDNLVRLPEFHQYLHDPDGAPELEMESPLRPDVTLLVTCVPAGSDMKILTGRDITQRVQVREMRKVFVADVSHELKTPLTVIQGHLEMLLDTPAAERNLSDPSTLALHRMAEHSERMAKIVGDLLTLSKLESSTLAENQGNAIDVSRQLRSIVEDIKISSGDSHRFELALDETLLLRGMEGEIHSALQNLINNAIAYTEPGTLIEVSWQGAGGNNMNSDASWSASPDYSPDYNKGLGKLSKLQRSLEHGVVFTVRDHGQGIEPEHIPKLSQRFYRVDRDRSRDSGGTGLGLAIVKYIAQRHGGQLDIASKQGEGSIFRIQLPASRRLATDQRNAG